MIPASAHLITEAWLAGKSWNCNGRYATCYLPLVRYCSFSHYNFASGTQELRYGEWWRHYTCAFAHEYHFSLACSLFIWECVMKWNKNKQRSTWCRLFRLELCCAHCRDTVLSGDDVGAGRSGNISCRHTSHINHIIVRNLLQCLRGCFSKYCVKVTVI